MFIDKTLRLNNLTRIAVSAKNSVRLICAETIIYLLLYNLHDCTFKFRLFFWSSPEWNLFEITQLT